MTYGLVSRSVGIQEQDTSNCVCVRLTLQVQSGDPDICHRPHQRPVPQNTRGQTPGDHTHKPTTGMNQTKRTSALFPLYYIPLYS